MPTDGIVSRMTLMVGLSLFFSRYVRYVLTTRPVGCITFDRPVYFDESNAKVNRGGLSVY